MSRFVFALHFVFIATILFPGCTAPAHLTHTSAALTQEEKMQQTINAWKGTHISKAIQKWGSPNEVSDDGTGWHTYIWQVPIHGFLAGQESRMQGFLPRQDHQIHPRRHISGMQGVRGTFLSTDYTYQFTFYTHPNGIIYKTLAKQNHDATSELKWK